MDIIVAWLLCMIYLGIILELLKERILGLKRLSEESWKLYSTQVKELSQDIPRFYILLGKHRARLDKLEESNIIYSLTPFELKYWFTEEELNDK